MNDITSKKVRKDTIFLQIGIFFNKYSKSDYYDWK